MSNTPNPQIQTRSTRYVPIYQTANGDGAIGEGGEGGAVEDGAYWIVNRRMYLEAMYGFGSSGTAGTGPILVSLPPGFTVADIDPAGLTNGKTTTATCLPTQAANPTLGPILGNQVLYAPPLLVYAIGTAGTSSIDLPADFGAVGDVLIVSCSLPLLELAIPNDQ